MKISEIQQHLTEKKLDAILISSHNHFLSQTCLASENQIMELSGYQGDALLIITLQKSFLFIEKSCEVMAANIINSDEIEIISDPNPLPFSWIRKNLPETAKVEYNPWHISISMIDDFTRMFPKIKLVATAELTPTEAATAFPHGSEYQGKEDIQKHKEVAHYMYSCGFEAALFTASDTVSWLTNMRSDALAFSPVVRAYALVIPGQKITLFADNLNLPQDFTYPVLPIAKLEKEIGKIKQLKFSIDKYNTPDAIRRIIEKHEINASYCYDYAAFFKNVKDENEIKAMSDAHLRDGIAFCKFLSWLNQNSKDQKELDIVEKIHEFHGQQPLFYSESIQTVVASGLNSAIPCYYPDNNNNQSLENNSLLRINCGGQYFNGTTVLSRTIFLETPPTEVRHRYTTVLKAHIALASAIFPNKIGDRDLDIICRSVMWRQGLDYNYETGHGVGYFLNACEKPHQLSYKGNSYPVEKNMVISIAPEYYRENAFGIRLENVYYITNDENSNMQKFSPLTLVPFDNRLIDTKLLTADELVWLNHYHKLVCQKVSPFLDTDEQKQWLKDACTPL